MTRREMTSALTFMLAFLPEGSAVALRADAPPGEQKPSDNRRNMESISVQTLLTEPLAEMPDAEVRMITLTVAPGATSPPHKHTGPVFAFVLEGEIENQVDPHPPRTYKAGGFFYEPPMHVHRVLKNLSRTKHAKLLICEVGEKGKAFTIGAS